MKRHTALNLLISLLLFSLLLISCSTEQTETSRTIAIDLDELPADMIDIAPYIDDIIVIPLETRSESMLGSSWILDYDKSNILYHCSQDQTIYRFSSDGKFLNKFCHLGKGPGEYSRIRCMKIVPGTKTFMASDARQKKMIQYDYKGKLIKEFSLPSSSSRFVIMDNGIIALHLSKMHSYVNDSVCHDLAFLDMEGNIVARQFFHDTPLQFAFGDPFTRPNEDGTHYYSRQFDFNLYSLSDTSQPEIAYEIDYGKYEGNIDDLGGPGIEAFAAYQKTGKKNGIDKLLNTSKSIAIISSRDKKTSMLVFNKKTQSILSIGVDSLNNIGYLNGFPIHIPIDSQGDRFVSLLDAIDLKASIADMSADHKKTLKKQVKGFDRILDINENDNPVLVLFKLK